MLTTIEQPFFFPYSGITTTCRRCCNTQALPELQHCLPCIQTRTFVVLDLDETLIHADDYSESEDTSSNLVEPDFYYMDVRLHGIYKRPGLSLFLEELFQQFWVGIWSAGKEDYVQSILKKILQPNQVPEFIFSRGQCLSDHDKKFVKPLYWLQCEGVKKLYHVDDYEHAFSWNLECGIPIVPFEYPTKQKDDTELKRILWTLKLLDCA